MTKPAPRRPSLLLLLWLLLSKCAFSALAASAFRGGGPWTDAARRRGGAALPSSAPSDANDDGRLGPAGLSIGFLGCGTIASAIATGLATIHNNDQQQQQQSASVVIGVNHANINGIFVTRRSAKKSEALQSRFPNLVTVCDSNQEVVDQADIIFLTVLPQQTAAVLQELNFDQKHTTLVSLVSTSQLDSLCTDSKLPVGSVYKMICLPAVAYNEGVCLLQTPKDFEPNTNTNNNRQHDALVQLLETLTGGGNVMLAADDRQMSAMMVPSGLMGAFYGMLRNNRDWLVQNAGLPTDQASDLVTRLYHGMLQDAVRRQRRRPCNHPDPDDDDDDDGGAQRLLLDTLIAEQTPGGLNEQALANGESLGVMEAYDRVQDAMFRRILGESDGSL